MPVRKTRSGGYRNDIALECAESADADDGMEMMELIALGLCDD
jgi:hypothetical protein